MMPMHSYVITLAKPRQRFTALKDSVDRNRRMVERFQEALDLLVHREGLEHDLGGIEPTKNLPVIFVTGTEKLASMISTMQEVRSVAKDKPLQYQLGQRTFG